MSRFFVGAALVGAAHAADLALTWTDCGDSSTHTKITGFSPAKVATGQKATMTGTGNLDEDVSGATFDLEMKTAAGTISCKGDASESKTCNLPLGVGSLTFDAMTFPIKKGSTSVNVDLSLSALLPGALAHTETKATATATGGDSLFCLDIKSAPAADEFVEKPLSTELALTWTDCGDSSTHTKITGFTPTKVTTGQKATMTGTGNLDEDVSGATFDLEMKTAAGTISCKGDASKSKTCNLPLGVGSLTFDAMAFPIKKGSTSVNVDLSLSALLPGALAHTETKATATATGGDKLFCLDIKSAPATDEVNVEASSCSDGDTAKWNGDAGHSQWQSDMTSCGTKCLGKGSCVTPCMAGKGWSSGCATCFGNLADCTAKHCLLKCMGGRTPGCVTCLKAAGCDTAAFGAGSCTGFNAPSSAVVDSLLV